MGATKVEGFIGSYEGLSVGGCVLSVWIFEDAIGVTVQGRRGSSELPAEQFREMHSHTFCLVTHTIPVAHRVNTVADTI